MKIHPVCSNPFGMHVGTAEWSAPLSPSADIYNVHLRVLVGDALIY